MRSRQGSLVSDVSRTRVSQRSTSCSPRIPTAWSSFSRTSELPTVTGGRYHRLRHRLRLVGERSEQPLTFPTPPAGKRAGRVRSLGVDRLWGRDPARFWWLVRVFGTPVFAWLGKGSVAYGVERIPRQGGVLVAANHFTALDPVLVGGLEPRAMHFFAKGQLFERSLLTESILWLGGIPVGRQADNRAALRHATELLRSGRVVGIFVEGARQRSDEMGEAMPGAALLATARGRSRRPVRGRHPRVVEGSAPAVRGRVRRADPARRAAAPA